MRRTRRPRPKKPASDALGADFGPGPEAPSPSAETQRAADGPIPGLACAGERCFLKPAADLVGRFAAGLGRRGHAGSMSRAALSGIELMKAFRDFLDEEIALAEKAAGKSGAKRYEKIRVE